MSTETAGRKRSTDSVPPSTTSKATVAATTARRRQSATRAAVKLGLEQLDHLPDRPLRALARLLIGELARRGLQLDDD